MSNSSIDKQAEVNRLQGEKKQLEAEEKSLRQIIESVKKQVSALQVEQLEVKNRAPLSRVSPSYFLGGSKGAETNTIEEETVSADLSLDLLKQIHRGNFVVQSEEEEEEESD